MTILYDNNCSQCAEVMLQIDQRSRDNRRISTKKIEFEICVSPGNNQCNNVLRRN